MARKSSKKPLKRKLSGKSPRGKTSEPQHRPDPRIDKAQRAWTARRYDDAIWFYERALDRDPTNPVLLVDVARVYAIRFRYAEAQKLVDLAQSLYANDANVQAMLGRSYVMLKQFDQAIMCLRRALELDPANPDRPRLLLELAKMHERLHDLDAARLEAEEALQGSSTFEMARYVLATIDRRKGNSEAAESRWRELIDRGKAPPGVIADSWYELASLHDRAGSYDAAFDDLLHAKQILKKASVPYEMDAEKIAAIGARTFRHITDEQLYRWHTLGPKLQPLTNRLAILTSHPRSGTTLLEQVLDSHPQAISADELQVMAEMVYVPLGRNAAANEAVTMALDRATPAELNSLRQSYLSAMEGALREPLADRMLLDKNPELTMLLPVIARVFPEMKIIFAIRDPRDVVLSCFMQRLPLNAVSVHYLTLKSTAEKYATTMNAWLKLRPMLQNDWIEVRYEDTVADLEGQARRVLDFLNLPWDDAVLKYHQRAQRKHVHSPTYEAVTKPVYASSMGRWRNYRQFFEPVQEILKPFIQAFGYEPS